MADMHATVDNSISIIILSLPGSARLPDPEGRYGHKPEARPQGASRGSGKAIEAGQGGGHRVPVCV